MWGLRQYLGAAYMSQSTLIDFDGHAKGGFLISGRPNSKARHAKPQQAAILRMVFCE